MSSDRLTCREVPGGLFPPRHLHGFRGKCRSGMGPGPHHSPGAICRRPARGALTALTEKVCGPYPFPRDTASSASAPASPLFSHRGPESPRHQIPGPLGFLTASLTLPGSLPVERGLGRAPPARGLLRTSAPHFCVSGFGVSSGVKSRATGATGGSGFLPGGLPPAGFG
ncbi:MAG: hypothetical protein CM15mP103_09750 [Gammaproteobacteria bacterium]|nr:MAG: hypothetical protein CM15mP103_09750 [Gammaproteobacteria bacterium]